MAILIDENTRVLVQGITGKIGTFHAEEMIDYGTNVVGGVTPGKGGTRRTSAGRCSTPSRTPSHATGAEASIVFVPPPFAADSIMEAADAGIRLCVAHHRRHPRAGHDPGQALHAPLHAPRTACG